MSDIAEREKLQADAGLPHLPTELTYELRMAVTGHRADEFLSWGYQWADKPHRLVYEACGVVEAQADEIARLKGELLQRDMTWLPAKDVEIATLKNWSVRLEVAIKSALRQLADGNSVLATDTLARALPTTTQERADG